jgi:predicted metal-binding protein
MSLIRQLQKYDFTEQKEFDPKGIILDQAVKNLCEQNTCGHYGKNHMCPPAVKGIHEWQKEISQYKKGILVTKAYPLKKKFDMEAIFGGLLDFQRSLGRIKENLENRHPDQRYLFLGAGACTLCKECTYEKNEPCRFPEKSFPSLEACGIDVMSLSKSAGVKYNNGENTVTYIGAILYTGDGE